MTVTTRYICTEAIDKSNPHPPAEALNNPLLRPANLFFVERFNNSAVIQFLVYDGLFRFSEDSELSNSLLHRSDSVEKNTDRA